MAADGGDDQAVAALEERARGREAQLVELVVDGRFFFDIEVGGGHVGFGLVEVVVGDEIFDRVVREKTFELVVELGGEGFVVGHDDGGAVGRLDYLGHGVGFARAGDAKQNLMLLAVEDASGERVDRRALVALGLVVADETEIHCDFYYRGRRGVDGLRESLPAGAQSRH